MKKYKDKYSKKTSILLMACCCVLTFGSLFFLKTFSVYEVHAEENMIEGSFQDPGDIYFTFYFDDQIQNAMPTKNEETIFVPEKSFCMKNGAILEDTKIVFDQDDWSFKINGMKEKNTKCSLYFASI